MKLTRTLAVGLSGALTVLSLGAGAVAPATAAAPEPGVFTPWGYAAGWLADEIDGGVYTSGGFPQYGPTLDAYYAFKRLNRHPAERRAIMTTFADEVGSYIGSGAERYAGPTGKLALAVAGSGRDATSFGGKNLVWRLKAVTNTSDSAQRGRASDDSEFGDYSNTVGQTWVVRAFAKLDKPYYTRLTARFLLKQQCGAGWFRQSVASSDFTCQTGKAEGVSQPSVDTTAYAVMALRAARAAGVGGLDDDIADALTWLRKKQNANGSFTADAIENANSTGLAGLALAPRHPKAAQRAARWIAFKLQVTPEVEGDSPKLVGEEGAVAFSEAALDDAKANGIPAGAVRLQFFLATAQSAATLRLTK